MELKPKQFEVEPDIFVSDTGHAWSAKINPELRDSGKAFYSEETINAMAEKIRALEAALDISARYINGEFQDPSFLAADYGGTGYEKHATVFAVGRQCLEVERLQKLSVENIMLGIVPGPDGMGLEVYAKSVDEVENKLSDMGEQLEEWILGFRSNFTPAALTCSVSGSGPNDVGIKWRGGLAKDGIMLYRLKSSI